ncbi:MAG: hypothetical protein HQK72_09315 [Desulfamplus sp.]|nr:hypothetical protein [Desulfamplus sp.]
MKIKVLIGLCITMIFMSSNVWSLSAPPYQLQRQLLNSVGASSLVDVGEVVEQSPANYVIDITTSKDDVANSLAVVLLRRWVFGNETLVIRVFRPNGTQVTSPKLNPWGISSADAIEKHFQIALKKNPFFVTTYNEQLPYSDTNICWVEVAKEVIQFFNDDISDYYGNTNLLARDVFVELFKNTFFSGTVQVRWTVSLDSSQGY